VIRAGFFVLSPSLFVFNEVLTSSFGLAIEDLLGRGVRDEVYRILENKGIRKDNIPGRFEKVIEALSEVFGESSRVIIHRVLRVLYEKYSLPVDFSYQETLLDRLTILKDRIVVDHLRPRGVEDVAFLPDKETAHRIKNRQIIGNPVGPASIA